MIAYLVRRAGVSIIVVTGISIVIFFLLHLMYAPPSFEGFHGPWFEQYLQYVDQLLHGNLGWSQIQNQSVAALFGERWPRTGDVAIVGDWHAMTLPIACQVLLTVAWYARYMRSSALDTLAQDYIVAARAKGLPEPLVLWRHLTRNAFLPMITLIGLSVPALLAGNVIAEYVWNYPGLGLLFYDALGNEDYPVMLAYTLVCATLTVLGNLVADIAMTVADPRIRLA